MPDVDIEPKAPPQSAAGPDSRGRTAGLRPAIIPIVATLLCLLPFVGRAFSMDDPLFLRIARQILTHPTNPYGTHVNWYGWDQPMWEVMKNPPLCSCYIAGIARLAGFDETALHIAFLLPAILAAMGTYLLAKRFCTRPVEAALIAVLTPVFLICSSTVMCDTMMLAFWVWAAFLWMKGLSEKRQWMLALSCALIAACALTKYYGMALVPLLMAYSIISRRRLDWPLAWFLVPAVILAAYQYWTKALYGHGLLLDAFNYAGLHRMDEGLMLLPRTLTGLCFAGGSLAGLIFYAPLLWSRKALMGYACFAGAVIALLGITGAVGDYPLRYEGHTYWGLIVHLGLFAAAGLSLLILALREIRSRDADAVLLVLWVVGTFLFAALGNWTVSARTLLPIAPAVGILIIRRMPGRPAVWPLVLCAVIALATANADRQFADSERTAAKLIHARFEAKGAMYFEGHWGFQHYMEPLGARPMIYGETQLREGDVLVVPRNNTNSKPVSENCNPTIIKLQATHWLTTMDGVLGVGFHSSIWGPVPYAFSRTTPERYRVVVVDRANIEHVPDLVES